MFIEKKSFIKCIINEEGNIRDVIASIEDGGFTDCLLQQGAKLVYGIDVGYGQTAWKIRNNSKVILFEVFLSL